jgi:hypothetical protein
MRKATYDWFAMQLATTVVASCSTLSIAVQSVAKTWCVACFRPNLQAGCNQQARQYLNMMLRTALTQWISSRLQ